MKKLLLVLVLLLSPFLCYGEVFVDDFNLAPTNPSDPRYLYDSYQLGVIYQKLDRLHPVYPGGGMPGVQNTVIWDGADAIVADANNSEELTCFLNTDYTRDVGSTVTVTIQPPIRDEHSTGELWNSPFWKNVGVIVSDRLIDESTIETGKFKGYMFWVNGGYSYYTMRRYKGDGTFAQTAAANPVGGDSDLRWFNPIRLQIKPTPTSWEFWYDGDGNSLSINQPYKLFQDTSSSRLIDSELKYFGFTWGCADATNQGVYGGTHAFVNTKIDKIEASSATEISVDANIFVDKFAYDPMDDYQAGLVYKFDPSYLRQSTFAWDGQNYLTATSAQAMEIASFINTKYVRQPGSTVSLKIQDLSIPLVDSNSWGFAGLIVSDKVLKDFIIGQPFNGYIISHYGDGAYIGITRYVNSEPNAVYVNPTGTTYPVGWTGTYNWVPFTLSIVPNGSNFDFYFASTLFGANSQLLYSDTSGLMADANLKYFGIAVGTNNGSIAVLNPARFDELKVTSFATAPAICGDAEHPYPVGDLDHDCYVNMMDLNYFAAYWLTTCNDPWWCYGLDHNQDAVVNFGDFVKVAEGWMQCTDPLPPCNFNP